jgi:hypothetical protein
MYRSYGTDEYIMLIMDSGKKLPPDAVQGQPRQNTCEHFAVDRSLNHHQLLSIQFKSSYMITDFTTNFSHCQKW